MHPLSMGTLGVCSGRTSHLWPCRGIAHVQCVIMVQQLVHGALEMCLTLAGSPQPIFEQLQHTNTCWYTLMYPSLATQNNLPHRHCPLISPLSLQIWALPGRLSTQVIRDTCLMMSVLTHRPCSSLSRAPSLPQIHNKFKDLVDQLLTEFITEMGVNPQEFYDVIATQHESDKLTGFVVQTILTVDDFLLFKAMMVKRNIDLTNQARALRAERGISRKGVGTLDMWIVCVRRQAPFPGQRKAQGQGRFHRRQAAENYSCCLL